MPIDRVDNRPVTQYQSDISGKPVRRISYKVVAETEPSRIDMLSQDLKEAENIETELAILEEKSDHNRVN